MAALFIELPSGRAAEPAGTASAVRDGLRMNDAKSDAALTRAIQNITEVLSRVNNDDAIGLASEFVHPSNPPTRYLSRCVDHSLTRGVRATSPKPRSAPGR